MYDAWWWAAHAHHRRMTKDDQVISLLLDAGLVWRAGWARVLMRSPLRRRPPLLRRVMVALARRVVLQPTGRLPPNLTFRQWAGPDVTARLAFIVHEPWSADDILKSGRRPSLANGHK